MRCEACDRGWPALLDVQAPRVASSPRARLVPRVPRDGRALKVRTERFPARGARFCEDRALPPRARCCPPGLASWWGTRRRRRRVPLPPSGLTRHTRACGPANGSGNPCCVLASHANMRSCLGFAAPPASAGAGGHSGPTRPDNAFRSSSSARAARRRLTSPTSRCGCDRRWTERRPTLDPCLLAPVLRPSCPRGHPPPGGADFLPRLGAVGVPSRQEVAVRRRRDCLVRSRGAPIDGSASANANRSRRMRDGGRSCDPAGEARPA
jgi:hypothetical protein